MFLATVKMQSRLSCIGVETHLEIYYSVEELVGHDRLLEFPEEGLEDDGGDVDVADVENDLFAGVDFGLKIRQTLQTIASKTSKYQGSTEVNCLSFNMLPLLVCFLTRK